MIYKLFDFSIVFLVAISIMTSQEFDGYITHNITFDTFNPEIMGLNRGRIIWKDRNIENDAFYLKYYSGAEIITLDSNLKDVNAAIDGDFIVWISDEGKVKAYNIRTWEITELDSAYYNTELYPGPTLSNGLVAYSIRDDEGTKILLKNLITGKDTTFDEGRWNMMPMVQYGQLAWTVSEKDFLGAPTNIYLYDGTTVKNITNTTANTNFHILRDGLLALLQVDLSALTIGVGYLDGDSVITVEFISSDIQDIAGFDISNGIIVFGIIDIQTGESTIKIYNTETRQSIALSESEGISGLKIDNNWVVWAAGTGFQKQLRIYHIDSGVIDSLGATDEPIVDDEQIAWTFGDAVELRKPINYTRLTNDGNNGWSQTRFVDIDNGNIVYGNYDNSQNARLFYWNGSVSKQLTDSIAYKDFVMVNDGYAIWREDFTNMWLFDGNGEPQKIIDSLQCENMYVADGYIGFHGFRIDAGNNINQSWIYNIADKTLKQITSDTSKTVLNGITIVDDGKAVWYRDDGTEAMLMYYDGENIKRLTTGQIHDQFAFKNGIVICSEEIDGVYQIVIYNPEDNKREIITNSSEKNEKPFTDGSIIAWFQGDGIERTFCYYDIGKKLLSKVTKFSPDAFRWLWMSNGKLAWRQGNEICIYDGNIISQYTNSGSTSANNEPYLDNEILLWKKDSPIQSFPQYGDIYTGKLHTHVAFDAEHIIGEAPISVNFYSRAWQGVRSHKWYFGDGETSEAENPVHIYAKTGVYSVTLTVTGPNGNAIETKRQLIRVLPPITNVEDNLIERNNILNIYPNPVRDGVIIEFFNLSDKSISIKISDVYGREIRDWLEDVFQSGINQIYWDGIDYEGSKVPDGIYFIRMYVDGNLAGKEKMIIKR